MISDGELFDAESDIEPGQDQDGEGRIEAE